MWRSTSLPGSVPRLWDRVGGRRVVPYRCNLRRLHPPGRLSKRPREAVAETAKGRAAWK